MDPALPTERSAMTLSGVEGNDPDFSVLAVGFRLIVTSDPRNGDFQPADGAHLSRLGDAIGNNTQLHWVTILFDRELANLLVDNSGFFDGLKRNSSIRELKLQHCVPSEEVAGAILNKLVAALGSLEGLILMTCNLRNGGAGVITSAVAGLGNIQRLVINDSNANDNDIVEIIPGVGGMRQLRRLFLRSNNIGRFGCEALAALLQDPNCNLYLLGLDNNNIDDDCAKILAVALKENKKLRRLGLGGNRAITEMGCEAFYEVLCNTMSINDTQNSNHALESLVISHRVRFLPDNLSSILELNRDDDKKRVSVRKILRNHPHLDMEPFFEWDLKVLPTAVAWFDRAEEYVENGNEVNIGAKKLSAIYQYARTQPMMFVPSPQKAGAKRRIDELN